MKPVIRIDLEKIIQGNEHVIIDLGCGQKKQEDRICIDRIDMAGIDIVADLEEGLSFLPDNSVDQIHCRSVLEHIKNFEDLMREIVRVLKSDGKAHVFVPHFSNPYHYSDFTHNRFFGLYSFYYFVSKENQLTRQVPVFYTDIRIKILSQQLVFKSSFKIINFIKKFLGWLINAHTLIQEYYEENLCYLLPCHGIEIVFSPDKKIRD